MWSTPEGMLSEEVGGSAFKAEIVADKNVRKVPMLWSTRSVHEIRSGKRALLRKLAD